MWYYIKNICIFAATVHTTLPIRTASQGVSFALKESIKQQYFPVRNENVYLNGVFI